MILALALPPLLVACPSGGTDSGGGSGGQPQACPPTIEIQGFAFQPARCAVKAGDSLTFINLDTAAHTATSDSGTFDTGNLGRNETSQSITYNTPGTFDYHCAFHPGMSGTIVVNP